MNVNRNNSNVYRYVTLIVLCFGAISIYFLPYMRWLFYDPLQQALNLNHADFGMLMTAYGITATIFYFPGGWLADKFSARKLLTISFLLTGLLGFYFWTLPSFWACVVIHLLWGVLSTLTFWAALIKATRVLGGKDEQGKFYGLLEGGRGLLNVLVTFLVLYLFSVWGSSVAGIRGVILLYSIVCTAAGVITWFLVGDNTESDEKKEPLLQNIKKTVCIPGVWLIAVVVFTLYIVLTAATYILPYLTNVFLLSAVVGGVIANIRSYGIQLLGGPIGGIAADKVRSSTRVTGWCMVLVIICLVGLLLLPANPAMVYATVAVMLLLSVGVYVARGIYFAIVDEINVPVAITGTAAGLISAIGFSPDAFIYSIFGNILDNSQGAAGYKLIFAISLVCAVVGFVAVLVLKRIVAKSKAATA